MLFLRRFRSDKRIHSKRLISGGESLESRELLTANVVGVSDGLVTIPYDHDHDHAESFYRPATTFLTSDVRSELRSSEAPNDPVQIALTYLTDHAGDFGLTPADFAHYRVSDSYVSQHNGTTHVYLRQLHQGLDVLHADINVSITSDGDVLAAGSSFVTGLNQALAPLDSSSAVATVADRVPQLSLDAALVRLAEQLELPIAAAASVDSVDSFDSLESDTLTSYPGGGSLARLVRSDGLSLDPIPTQLRYVPQADGSVELAWGMVVRTPDERHWYDASVSASDGRLLSMDDWASHATYNVFATPSEGPADGERSLVADVEDPTASPLGWHDSDTRDGFGESTRTIGNNVIAQEDLDADDAGGFRPTAARN